MAAVRRNLGFKRYVLSLQYHGSSFLGFSSQGENEDCILANGKTDLRGYRSVESRLAQALTDLVGEEHWESLQVSSRTDRGVHALKNTCHVDIEKMDLGVDRIHRGLNFFLRRQQPWFVRELQQSTEKTTTRKRRMLSKSAHTRLGDCWVRYDPMNEMRVLQVKLAPETMPNPFAAEDQPAEIDWNARFSATQRTYLYRILYSSGRDVDWAAPFEWDRSWRIHGNTSLDVEAMREAASFLIGQHDFSSFRGKRCQRSSPVVNLCDIIVQSQPYNNGLFPLPSLGGSTNTNFPSVGANESSDFVPGQTCRLVNLFFTGNAFLYRQVRNLAGCLVQVGKGRLPAHAIPDLLAARDRSLAPAMAPAHGLFLVNVKHGDFEI